MNYCNTCGVKYKTIQKTKVWILIGTVKQCQICTIYCNLIRYRCPKCVQQLVRSKSPTLLFLCAMYPATVHVVVVLLAAPVEGVQWGLSCRGSWHEASFCNSCKIRTLCSSFYDVCMSIHTCAWSGAKNFGCCTSVWMVFLRMFTSSRGYGGSDKPPKKSDYTLQVLKQDIAELVGETLKNNCTTCRCWFQFLCCVQIPALGHEKCILVAHDWGGAIAW